MLLERETDQANVGFWLVGSDWQESGDQTERFLQDGVWENGYEDRYLDEVKSEQPGDRIAIKAAFTSKSGLPFESFGRSAAVMRIKATGVVVGNAGDGRRLVVQWKREEPARQWYFHTYRSTITKVEPKGWMQKNLISFVFEGNDQDLNRFLAEPYWSDRYQATPASLEWPESYEAIATKLLEYRNRQDELIQFLHVAADSSGVSLPLVDKLANDERVSLTEICPFTFFGMFNRGVRDETRTKIIQSLIGSLGLNLKAPKSFIGVPLLSNMKTWFFSYGVDRLSTDIPRLWDIFESALRYVEVPESRREHFQESWDRALEVRQASWNLGIGLFWMRPDEFLPLDSNTREFIQKSLKIPMAKLSSGSAISGAEYLELIEKVRASCAEENSKYKSFPQISFAAWRPEKTIETADTVDAKSPKGEDHQTITTPGVSVSAPEYTLDDLINSGCFHAPEFVKLMWETLELKKNIILQGPPGTGKSWLARRLAWLHCGERKSSRVLAVQFHANTAYEDFVCGYRPDGLGGLSIVDGPLIRHAEAARANPDQKFVLLVEEVNRGNPAKVLGECLTLLESDKRSVEDGIQLSYKRDNGDPFYLPPNLYVIGIMNLADRSLALVDLALRRRFSFFDLEPRFDKPWQTWLREKCAFDQEIVQLLQTRLASLNHTISSDRSLGQQYQIGHSFLTPPHGAVIDDPLKWYQNIVNTELRPLLWELWFDDPERAEEQAEMLLIGL